MVTAIIVGVLAAVAFGLALTKPRAALYGVIFLAPWEGLDVDVGLRLSAYQVALAPLVLISLLRLGRRGAGRTVSLSTHVLTLFILYAIVRSLLQVPFLPDAQVSGGVMRSPEVRAIIQIAMFLFVISPVFIVPLILKQPGELVGAAKVYLAAVLVLACLGWIQLLIWYGTGTNPLPIGYVNDLLGGVVDVRDGAYEFMDLWVYRMNSFGGEPKNLGQAFVVGMMIIQVMLTTTRSLSAKKLYYLWILLAVSTVATLSTTAFFLWVIGTGVHLAAQKMFRVGYERTRFASVRLAIVMLIPLMVLISSAEAMGIPVVDMLLDRTVNRVAESQFGVFEDFDSAINDYFFDYPMSAIIGVGLGNIHLYADSYLDPEVAIYAGGAVFVAKAQYLRFISEIGVVGLGLFLFWYWLLVYFTGRRLAKAPSLSKLRALVPYGTASVAIFMAAGAGASQFYLGAGVIAAAYAMSRGDTK